MASETPEASSRFSVVDFVELIARLEVYLGEFYALVVAIAWATGIAAIVIGTRAAAMRSEQGPGSGGWSGAIAWILMGVCLIMLPSLLDVLSQSVIRDSWSSVGVEIFSTAPELVGVFDGQVSRTAIVGILRFVQLLGVIAIFRGLLILNASVQPGQQPTIGAGMTYLGGGVLALNIGPVLAALNDLVAS